MMELNDQTETIKCQGNNLEISSQNGLQFLH
jgi:hypothetical protein